jgi:hypothetical protein
MDLPAGQRRPSARGDLGDDVLLAVVEDRMDGASGPSKLRPAPQGVWWRSVKNDWA